MEKKEVSIGEYEYKERALWEGNLCTLCYNRVCQVRPLIEDEGFKSVIVTRCRYYMGEFKPTP